jgi:arylsulfatase A-like enzyme
MTYTKGPDGTLQAHRDRQATWDHSPLYEEVVALPLLIAAPGVAPGAYGGISSAVDVMPTVLDWLGEPIPPWVEGRSLLPALRNRAAPGRAVTVSTLPFANPDDQVNSVDNVSRTLREPLVTTVTSTEWALLYSPAPGRSELFHLPTDPRQERNVISGHAAVARDHHRMLLDFLAETRVPPRLIEPRRELRM